MKTYFYRNPTKPHSRLLTGDSNPVLKASDPAIRIVDHDGRLFVRECAKEERLLNAIQTAASVKSPPFLHRILSLTIN